jgi:type II protein arginine methyltransferase
MVLDSGGWSSTVVGKTSPWIDLDSPSEAVRRDSEAGLKQEIAWASHLGVPALSVRVPARSSHPNLARALNSVVQQSEYIHFWLRVPLCWPEGLIDSVERATPRDASAVLAASTHAGKGILSSATSVEDSVAGVSACEAVSSAAGVAVARMSAREDRDPTDPWEAWNAIRCMCEFHPQLSLCLELTHSMPNPEQLRRWQGEPVKAMVIPLSLFVDNKAGYPVLRKKHQEFVIEMLGRKVQLILSGRPKPIESGDGSRSADYRPHLDYIAHLATKVPSYSSKDEFEAPYYDYLQAPLQPLMDNLESSTYETFERDPVKYQLYQEAIRRALEDTPKDKESVVMVVGAGRGPLVHRALVAAEEAGRAIRVWAVEKNPNAVITLRNRAIDEGWDNVTIVSHDMRTWEAPELADILVSELLGSFGDNELSPECLDGAQKFLKEDGVSIPQWYTSFASPVMSSKLWNEVKSSKDLDKSFETAYVVKMHNFVELDSPQPCHTFEHPNKSTGPIDNARYSVNRFTARSSGMVHGFGGYFECGLYKDVLMSINPKTHSPGMFSWFPIFFPIRHPFYVSEGDTIELQLWRCASSTKVWYEWSFTSPEVTSIHNPGGRSYWIGL